MFILIHIPRKFPKVITPLNMTSNYKNLDLPEELESLLNKIQSLSGSEEVLEFIESTSKKTKGFKKLNEVTYFFKGFILSSMMHSTGNDIAEKLNFAKDLDIKSAPGFIDFIETEDLTGILVLKYPDSETGLPIPLDQYEEKVGAIKEEEKRQFLYDMEKLAINGKVHPFAIESPYSWFVSCDSGKIILEKWSLLADIDPKEREDNLSKIKENLELLS